MRSVLALALAVAPGAVVAAEAASRAATGTAATGAPVGSISRLLVGLLVVVAVLALAAWGARRLGAGRSTSGGVMRVIASTAVGQRERVVLLAVGDAQYVIGVAPGRVTGLGQLDEPVAEIEPAAGGDFAANLQRMLASRGGS